MKWCVEVQTIRGKRHRINAYSRDDARRIKRAQKSIPFVTSATVHKVV